MSHWTTASITTDYLFFGRPRLPLAGNRDITTSCLCARLLRLVATWGGVRVYSFFLEVMIKVFKIRLQGSVPTTKPNQGDTSRCVGGCGTSTGIDPSPIQRELTSRLGSIGQRCPPILKEEKGQGGLLMSDSYYCRTVTIPTPGSTPPPIRVAPLGKQGAHTVGMGVSIISCTVGLHRIEVGHSGRRSRQDDSTGKEVGREDKVERK
ncbi:hypothetical protein PoB_002150000 [Plakobranchus ocellatus]|uniref:Uncharacterized protein n=1 Tax=Plakobranchus ocellatus TaxID=259542 RepID=A0AAV3ZIP1_9GAST|nr:hypothetical protein PoB_002150000 [Plakobranchus ocellatus]